MNKSEIEKAKEQVAIAMVSLVEAVCNEYYESGEETMSKILEDSLYDIIEYGTEYAEKKYEIMSYRGAENGLQ